MVDRNNAVSVKQEIMDAVGNAKGSDLERARLQGLIFGQLMTAAIGELRLGLEDGEVLEPIRRNPELWEIKWKYGKGKTKAEYRLYHAEPGRTPPLVGLRFHQKETTGSSADIEDAQNAEIDKAGKRFRDGAPRAWGHTRNCTNCVTP